MNIHYSDVFTAIIAFNHVHDERRRISHILNQSKLQTCQVSRNFRESPEMVYDLQVSRKCYKKTRGMEGISLIFYFLEKNAFGVNPRDFWCEQERCQMLPERRLRSDYVCINSRKRAPLEELTPLGGASLRL